MQKVTLIHIVYLSHKNGANTVIRSLLRNKDHFALNGIDIRGLVPEERVYSSETGGKYAKFRKRVVSFIKNKLMKLSQRYVWAMKSHIYMWKLRPAKMMAKRYLSQMPSKEDVVFVHSLFTTYYYLKYRKEKQRVVLVLHTNGESYKMLRIYYNKLESSSLYHNFLEMERYVLENVDRIVLVAQKPREVFLNCHNYIDPQKVFYVYNGVEKTSAPIKSPKACGKQMEICCVASITLRKGQHYIIDSLNSIKEKPNVHFTFVGDGSDRSRLEEQVKICGLQHYVSFVGISNDVVGYLKKSDAFILPSEDEGLPMAILEAMRESLPIIATPVGGILELLIDGYNGVLIQPTVVSVCEFIEHLYDYDWEYLGRNSRKMFEEKFTVEKMVDNYSKLLKFQD